VSYIHTKDAAFSHLIYGRRAKKEWETFYDQSIKHEVSEKIKSLIMNLSLLDDIEIILSLSEVLALLDDSHTSILVYFWDEVYPLEFSSFYNGFYCISAPATHENLLYSKLYAINGVSIDEIIERSGSIIPHENEYFLKMLLPEYIIGKDFLIYLGITDDTGEVGYSFIDSEGHVSKLTVDPIKNDELEFIDTVSHNINYEEYLMHSNPDENYWYEYRPDDRLMYIRYKSCIEMIDIPYSIFVKNLVNEIKVLSVSGDVDKIVIDLRYNGGGDIYELTFAHVAQTMTGIYKGPIYILINNETLSAGIVYSSMLKSIFDNSYLVGEPTGAPPNFFAYGGVYELPLSSILYTVSGGAIRMSDYNAVAIIPDIYIPFTIDDFKNDHDPVLEAIKVLEY